MLRLTLEEELEELPPEEELLEEELLLETELPELFRLLLFTWGLLDAALLREAEELLREADELLRETVELLPEELLLRLTLEEELLEELTELLEVLVEFEELPDRLDCADRSVWLMAIATARTTANATLRTFFMAISF